MRANQIHPALLGAGRERLFGTTPMRSYSRNRHRDGIRLMKRSSIT